MTTNTSFIEGTSLQWAWDSTSLGLLKTCPRKYQLTMIDEWRAKNESHHLTFGIAFHSALEAYDRSRAEGQDHHSATRRAVLEGLTVTGKRSPEGVWQAWNSPDNRKTRFTLIRAVVWYLEQFAADPCVTVQLRSGSPAVELSFRMELPLVSPRGEPYILCGHLDRLVEFSGAYWFLDRKTTGSALSQKFFEQFSPHNQMSLYDAASNIILGQPVRGGIIDGVECAVGFNRFGRGFVSRTKSQRDEWLTEVVLWIKQAEGYAQANLWPMNDCSCDKYGGCPFRGVCSKDKSVREVFLREDFMKQQWNPLETREV